MLTETDFIRLVGPLIEQARRDDLSVAIEPSSVKIYWRDRAEKLSLATRSALRAVLTSGPCEVAGPVAQAITSGCLEATVLISDTNTDSRPENRSVDPLQNPCRSNQQKIANALKLLS